MENKIVSQKIGQFDPDKVEKEVDKILTPELYSMIDDKIKNLKMIDDIESDVLKGFRLMYIIDIANYFRERRGHVNGVQGELRKLITYINSKFKQALTFKIDGQNRTYHADQFEFGGRTRDKELYILVLKPTWRKSFLGTRYIGLSK